MYTHTDMWIWLLVSLYSNNLLGYGMSFTGYTLESYIAEALPVTSAIKHMDTQLCVCSVKVMCGFIAYYISFVPKQRGTDPKHLFKRTYEWIEKFHYWRSLATTTAYWCVVSVRDGWIKQHLFATLIPWFQHNLLLPVSTFHKSFCRKWQSKWDAFYWSVVLLQFCCLFRCCGLTLSPFSGLSSGVLRGMQWSILCDFITVHDTVLYFQCHLSNYINFSHTFFKFWILIKELWQIWWDSVCDE